MRVAVHFNPRSGRGKAAALAQRIADAASRAGHGVELLPTRPGHPLTKAEIEGIEVLAVAGGDGTIHWTLDALHGASTAVYHVPCGTENLFAREFGSTAQPQHFVDALARGSVARVDLGACNGELFSLMCSFGPDAGIIHRLCDSRTGPITTASYLRPVLAELIEPRIPKLSIWSDGRPVISRQRGMLVVGNSRHYAWGLNPARDADVDDGLLDFAFFPSDTVADVLLWAAKLGATWDRRRTRHRTLPKDAIQFRSSAARVEAHEGECLCQMDGEQKKITQNGGFLDFRTLQGSLRVLKRPNTR